jgi:hypothetical protein
VKLCLVGGAEQPNAAPFARTERRTPEMVEQSLSGPGKLRWYEKENKNVRNLKVHTEKLLHGSMSNPLHHSYPNIGNLVLTQLNNDNRIFLKLN